MTKNITINKITIDPSWDMKALTDTMTKFNATIGTSYCKKYIGTSKVYSKDIVKKIKVGDGESFTIRFIIGKRNNPTTNILYLVNSPGGSEVVYSRQEYTKYEDFEKDLNYILKQISNMK